MDTKSCRVCRDRKPLSEFNCRKVYADGLDTRCKSCELKYDRERIAKHPGIITTGTKICSFCKLEKEVKEYSKRLRSKDGLRNRCKQCDKKAEKEYRDKNPDQRYINIIRQKYNITKEEYLALLEKQQYQCAICGELDKLVLDHCHTTLKVRGLLCSKCNSGLGMFLDNIHNLEKAIKYLNE
jgi:hypothetical protein